ncbi:uncharacterized protein LOC110007595 isoform X1 [Amborella trichopoda]|uniref:uncharacterized protein LOC110007595 isoform X1 n=1 Tax=Amborella trichopoda TaxID=13333 RepID=UPI0009C1A250|nr:uncharacterized protein LOC110007595 isoform X1 [Amborella trichopoda]|eukprot:XP_020525165.1 uncharacterized protein LOC110007595 isoform X1 [Amborella trichopoda]
MARLSFRNLPAEFLTETFNTFWWVWFLVFSCYRIQETLKIRGEAAEIVTMGGFRGGRNGRNLVRILVMSVFRRLRHDFWFFSVIFAREAAGMPTFSETTSAFRNRFRFQEAPGTSSEVESSPALAKSASKESPDQSICSIRYRVQSF